MAKFYTYYNRRKPVMTDVGDNPSMTDQSFKDECDLKTIVDTYCNKNIPIPVPTMNYVDCTTVMEYEQAVLLAREAQSNFANLPSNVRERFNGSVEEYLDFINKKENLQACVDMNLVDINSIPQDMLDTLKKDVVVNDVEIQPTTPPVDVAKDVAETQ